MLACAATGHCSTIGSTILLGMWFLLDLAVKDFGEKSQFLSYKALSFPSNP
jgi:hypothetical protein